MPVAQQIHTGKKKKKVRYVNQEEESIIYYLLSDFKFKYKFFPTPNKLIPNPTPIYTSLFPLIVTHLLYFTPRPVLLRAIPPRRVHNGA